MRGALGVDSSMRVISGFIESAVMHVRSVDRRVV